MITCTGWAYRLWPLVSWRVRQLERCPDLLLLYSYVPFLQLLSLLLISPLTTLFVLNPLLHSFSLLKPFSSPFLILYFSLRRYKPGMVSSSLVLSPPHVTWRRRASVTDSFPRDVNVVRWTLCLRATFLSSATISRRMSATAAVTSFQAK